MGKKSWVSSIATQPSSPDRMSWMTPARRIPKWPLKIMRKTRKRRRRNNGNVRSRSEIRIDQRKMPSQPRSATRGTVETLNLARSYLLSP